MLWVGGLYAATIRSLGVELVGIVISTAVSRGDLLGRRVISQDGMLLEI